MIKTELTTIALWVMASEMGKNVEGMESFPAFYLKSLSPGHKRLVLAYEKAREANMDQFLAHAEKDGWDKPPTKKS